MNTIQITMIGTMEEIHKQVGDIESGLDAKAVDIAYISDEEVCITFETEYMEEMGVENEFLMEGSGYTVFISYDAEGHDWGLCTRHWKKNEESTNSVIRKKASSVKKYILKYA